MIYPSARIQPSVIATATDVGLLENIALHKNKFWKEPYIRAAI